MTQPIANLRAPIDFYIELHIKRDRRYHMELRNNSVDGSYLIDDVSMLVRNVNYRIFLVGMEMNNMRYSIVLIPKAVNQIPTTGQAAKKKCKK
ncbi:hypothetical protein HU200_058372 [Digitaria exilis]|uniref:Uncharacterized protein n=1 Tax=Digitaria exilis TaxID=1010633 RepID=A0A835AI66_9POAL|nr:hypothetical protein HU200_058372 [Digitaria exilis]